MACAVKEGDTMDQKVFLRGDYHNLGDPVRTYRPRDSQPERARAAGHRPKAAGWNWRTGLSIRAIRCRRA